MKKYYCDVCETELPNWDETTVLKLNQAASICGLTELCPRCDAISDGINISGLVMSELKRLAGSKQESLTLPPAPALAPKGKAAREKRRILTAIEAYRKEQGPGSIPRLAELAKVSESDLRDIVSCVQIPIATWRAVGKVLGVYETTEERGMAP